MELGAVTLGVATDSDGNVCIAGYTDGSFGGPNRGGNDVWVAKYSAAGALRWKRQLGTAKGDGAFGVATDRDGNVYIAGDTDGSFGGPNQGVSDAWVAKYSATGALRWKRQLGTSLVDWATGVATDGDGNVYIAGQTGGSLGGPSRGDFDAWVAKYSAAGVLRWKRQFGTSNSDGASGVATDGDGNVYIAGSTGPYQGEDAWVAKYSTAGALRWRRQLRTAKGDDAHGVATDGDGNVYVAGRMGCCVGVPPGADAWLAKYSAMGALHWKRQLKTSEGEAASGVATDGDGNVYMAGATDGSLGGPSEGYNDAWLAKYYTQP
jgi:Beta-propeller repeat